MGGCWYLEGGPARINRGGNYIRRDSGVGVWVMVVGYSILGICHFLTGVLGFGARDLVVLFYLHGLM